MVRLIRWPLESTSDPESVYACGLWFAGIFVLSRLPGNARPLSLSRLILPTLLTAFCVALPTAHAAEDGLAEPDETSLAPGSIVTVKLPEEATVVPYDRHAGTGHVLLARRETGEAMRLDGHLDEAAWRGLRVHDDFRLIDPDTLAPGSLPTRVRMFYTERGFYLGVDMIQDPGTLVEHLSGRDQGMLNRDYFSFTLDTSGEGRYGFWFQLSLGNSISDGTILPERNYSTSWDGAWRGGTARTAEGWSAEYFVPWALVNMPKAEGLRTIGIFAQRNVAYVDERYAWPPLPWTRPKFLSEFQALGLEDVSPRQQYSVTPYVAAAYDRFRDGEPKPKAGVDMLWRPSSNFQLTSTLNPDFGNVEADDVVVNLSNYETFFPEKRLFFQEGQEVFTTNGRRFGDPLSLLHTRRIGAPAVRPETPEGATLLRAGLGRPADLLGAVKTTGQHGALRYGFLGVGEDDARFDAYAADGSPLTLHQDGRDFGALRMLYEHANGGYKAIGFISTAVRHPQRMANVNAVDGQFISPGGRLRASSQLISSDVTGTGEDGMGGFLDLAYAPRQGLSHYLSLDAFDDAIQINDMGYQRRNDYRQIKYRMRVSSPNFDRFRNTRTYLRVDRMWNTAGQLVDSEISVDQQLTLHNLSQIRFSGGIKPAHYDDRGSFGNGAYRIDDAWEAELRYYSDSSRRLTYSIRQRWTEEPTDGGVQRRTQGLVRWRPTDRMTMGIGVRYVDREAWLLHQSDGAFTAFAADEIMPNFDLSYFFSARQQLRMAFQWVAIKADERSFYRMAETPGFLLPVEKDAAEPRDDFAISRMNLQVRYRWEIAPLSDLFLVYTNNAGMPYADAAGKDFGELFAETFEQTTGENLVLKFRYRFGS